MFSNLVILPCVENSSLALENYVGYALHCQVSDICFYNRFIQMAAALLRVPIFLFF
jgi:hypothetical protein